MKEDNHMTNVSEYIVQQSGEFNERVDETTGLNYKNKSNKTISFKRN